MYCQKIYDQMLVIDWVLSNLKLANTKIANKPTKFILPLFQTIL